MSQTSHSGRIFLLFVNLTWSNWHHYTSLTMFSFWFQVQWPTGKASWPTLGQCFFSKICLSFYM